jgi:CRP/FNR family cyclic AMP-dependent transcriptional regulator
LLSKSLVFSFLLIATSSVEFVVGTNLGAAETASYALLEVLNDQFWTEVPTAAKVTRGMGERSEAGSFFSLLGEGDRRELQDLGRVTRFARGTRLMHEGEPGETVMVVLGGHVKASCVTPEGHELVLSFRGPGDVLGELSFLDEQRRSSSVTAIEPVEALVITGKRFASYLESTPGAAMKMIDIISRRFRDANRKRIGFGASDTTGRVAARLTELVERYGEPNGHGSQIQLPITQDELGSWTASSRAGVAKALKTLRDLGWIETDRRKITVCDIEALRDRAA